MAQPANVLQPHELQRFLATASSGTLASRNRVMILLSFKAGLRACEIAGLTWAMVTTGSGTLAETLVIERSIAKNGRGRRVPIHPELRSALQVLKRDQAASIGPVIRSLRGGHLTPGSVVNWFADMYQSAGLQGCSSHSGRRTFITNAARMTAKVGGSLRDVQELAGHANLSLTERYIAGNREAQRKLVRMI